MPDLRLLLVERPFRIAAYDVDVMGIVSNLVYIRWFEDLRFAFLDEYWPYEDMTAQGLSPILAETHAHYHLPLTIHERPTGRAWVEEMRAARWTLGFEIASDAGVHCTGRQRGFIYHLERKRPVRLPPQLMEPWEAARRAAER